MMSLDGSLSQKEFKYRNQLFKLSGNDLKGIQPIKKNYSIVITKFSKQKM